ncbi:MAG: arginine--tRNA ligase, partial [Acidimicrobiia bacterium]
MADPLLMLEERVAAAIPAALGDDFAGSDPVVRRSTNPSFGDYQANAAMALGKRAGRPPREVAQAIVEHLQVDDLCVKVEVAGPGFINLTLREDALEEMTEALLDDRRLGVMTAGASDTVVIDYSSPNVAREMHVGHLRSTVIGDSLARTLEFLGHNVIRQNHFGDWGTQFGMLIEHLVDEGWTPEGDHRIADLNALYQAANQRFKDDDAFAERARRRVVSLQSGDEATGALWRALVQESARHFEQVYARLGVTLRADDIRGESFYNDRLNVVADELEERGLARIDDGALCAFPAGFTNRDGDPLPLIVRKADGGFGYAATDLAAIRFRSVDLSADEIVYVVDARQGQHFAMIFAVAKEAGWLPPDVRAEHVAFGMILGTDGKPFRTRSGETVKLVDLLDEAEERASAVVAEKNPELSDEERAAVARTIGVGAVKYSDLSNDRVKDYVFDWDRMLAFEGNTAPYLQYAHARICSIFRRAEGAGAGSSIVLGQDAERELALQLLSLPSVVVAAAEHLQPHRLCTYLYETASAFTTFYEKCSVLRAETDELRSSRLALCELTARTLALGLSLLGIEA